MHPTTSHSHPTTFKKFLDKRYIKIYNTHVTKVTPFCGPLAQLAEHLTFNQGVPRSSRGWITIFFALFLGNVNNWQFIAKDDKINKGLLWHIESCHINALIKIF
jgi:hypothetical protein